MIKAKYPAWNITLQTIWTTGWSHSPVTVRQKSRCKQDKMKFSSDDNSCTRFCLKQTQQTRNAASSGCSVATAQQTIGRHIEKSTSQLYQETRNSENYAERRFTSFAEFGATDFGESLVANWNAAVSTIQPAWLKMPFFPRKKKAEQTTLKSFGHHRC